MSIKIDQTDYAYMAGYIDGDGCFYIGTERRANRLRHKYIISIVISSVNQRVLLDFQNMFGGSVSLINREYDNRKSLYQFSIKKYDTIKLANNILPYLVEKREECQIALDFVNSNNPNLKDEYINRIRLIKDVGNLASKYHKEEFDKFKSTIQPTIYDFAYLAGFIDAECSLNIQRDKPKDNPNYVYKILLQCNNTKAPVFKWLIQRFGGRIQFIDRRNHGKARKNQLSWRITGRALSKILPQIYPFLKHKKPVCEQLIRFYATTLKNGGARHTEKFRSEYAKVIRIREEIVAEVHKLNLKGIKHISG